MPPSRRPAYKTLGMRKLRIAICQFPVSHDVERNASWIRDNMSKAAALQASVIHFPETALTGYGNVAPETQGTDFWQALEKQHGEIEKLASAHGIWVVMGTRRRVGDSTLPANSTYIISDSGQVAAIYDKQKLLPAEKEWYSPGDSDTIVTILGVKCGFLICYELQFPEFFDAYRQE